MLKIGEFSKLAHITVKALRFYEKEGLLIPAHIDSWTGYRNYDTNQLLDAARIKAFRQLGLSVEEIKCILSGDDALDILGKKANDLENQRKQIDVRLSIINHILEDKEMKYQVTEKVIPETLVYYSEATLENYSDIMSWIPAQGQAALELNPELKCAEPAYEFCEYLDCEYKDKNFRIRHNEAVTFKGKENDQIKFRAVPETKVLSIFHKGSYSTISEAYAFAVKYASENGYKINGYFRESYIDGIWNKESEEDWLTEIQIPIK